jgi:hypothetical protein
MVFIGTWNAGSSTPGDPYLARWPDEFGNLQSKEIRRPEVIANYFKNSNCIDSHNHVRQKELGLEMKWRTTNCWFRLATTMFGITVTDSWRALKHHKQHMPEYRNMSAKTFAELLVYDLWHKPFAESDGIGCIRPPSAINIPVDHDTSLPDVLSPMTASSTSTNSTFSFSSESDKLYAMFLSHPLGKTQKKEGVKRPEPARRTCRMKADGCRCKGAHNRYKTTKECFHPACLRMEIKSNANLSTGVFICENLKCLEKHLQDCLDISKN